MIRIDNIVKTYGKQTLFNKASLQVQAGERIGLVGRNGSGKSTLFQMILGEFEPDDGVIIVPSGYKIGHVAQHLHFTEDTILKEGCLGLNKDEIYDHYKVESILSGLGFSEEDFYRPPSYFSGGYQVRLNLAKVLVSNPNLLLLDEPTNYLDIVSVRWIIKFLRRWKHELIVISHDRDFIDNVSTHTALIHREKITKLSGTTEKIYTQIAQDEEVYEKTRQNEERQRKHIESFVERFRAQASKAKLVQSRIKLLEKMPELDELTDLPELDFNFRYSDFEAKQLMDINKISFGYDSDNILIKNLDFVLGSKDRIGIIGKNGRGKSTLIKLMAKELDPISGEIKIHLNAKIGYFGRTNIDRLSPELTVEQEIDSANPMLGKTAVRSICGAMMFGGDLAEKLIKVLSGGEKSRVMLGKILARPSNLLLLDEPTNHLDMQSIDSMIEALREFPGAIAIVTHSELVLRSIVTKLIVFQDDEVFCFNGTYDEFLDRIGWKDEADEKEKEKSSSPIRTNSKKLLRQMRAEIITKRSKILKPMQNEIKMLENKIEQLESEEAVINERLSEAIHAQNHEEIGKHSKSTKKLKDEIDICFKKFEKISAEHDAISESFEKELNELK